MNDAKYSSEQDSGKRSITPDGKTTIRQLARHDAAHIDWQVVPRAEWQGDGRKGERREGIEQIRNVWHVAVG